MKGRGLFCATLGEEVGTLRGAGRDEPLEIEEFEEEPWMFDPLLELVKLLLLPPEEEVWLPEMLPLPEMLLEEEGRLDPPEIFDVEEEPPEMLEEPPLEIEEEWEPPSEEIFPMLGCSAEMLELLVPALRIGEEPWLSAQLGHPGWSAL